MGRVRFRIERPLWRARVSRGCGGRRRQASAALPRRAIPLDTPPADAFGQSETLHLLGLAAGAGFGGAALIRARRATIRLPSKRCVHRYHKVHELMVGIDFERAKRRLPRELFLAMQSVPEEEAAQVSRPIDEIDRMDDLSSQDKSYLLGYYLLDLVGKEFLAAVLEDLTRRAEYLLPEVPPE